VRWHSTGKTPPRRIAKHSFGIDNVKNPSGVVDAIKTNQKTANVRPDFLCLAVGVHTAPATVITNPTKSTVLTRPAKLRSGTIARQAIAPPVKSAPYNGRAYRAFVGFVMTWAWRGVDANCQAKKSGLTLAVFWLGFDWHQPLRTDFWTLSMPRECFAIRRGWSFPVECIISRVKWTVRMGAKQW